MLRYTGIWFDYLWRRVRLTRNVIINNGPFKGEHAGAPWTAGVMFEISNVGQALVDNNVIAASNGGPGIFGQDANNITVAYNLVFGNTLQPINLGGITGRKYPTATPGCGAGEKLLCCLTVPFSPSPHRVCLWVHTLGGCLQAALAHTHTHTRTHAHAHTHTHTHNLTRKGGSGTRM
jgi:hypothetical protein